MNGRCIQRWEALEQVRDKPRVRYCAQCQAAVHLVENETDLAELVRMGKNVAVLRADNLGAPPSLHRIAPGTIAWNLQGTRRLRSG